ncbi:MAG: HAMP domain-containing histidine kinase [Candidatus Nealsonbacteria bacterium]|nr:HAMP domain-containing histidine kinase [Candidatus Nealsonbacteria bacterium]
MPFQEIIDQLNFPAQCKKYGLPLRNCPQFLFLIMGGAIGVTALVTYNLGTRYFVDPNTVALIVMFLTVLLFTISFSIIRSLERIAEANRMKSEFISIVSHQLRSPLSNLKWSTELLSSGRLGEIPRKQGEYLQIIEENIIRMGELVSDLLMVSRIEQGKLPLEKTTFSLVDVAEQIINKIKPFAQASNVEIIFEAQPNLKPVFADLSQTKSAIENLLDNAVRYTKARGQVKIKIEQRRGGLLFMIKDSGVGIPTNDQKHIFQKFFRSANVLKHQTQGSGLGLYIVKSIIEKSGGRIWFNSREGEGTTFWFTLPAEKGEANGRK